jgi:hypothetical protein
MRCQNVRLIHTVSGTGPNQMQTRIAPIKEIL